MPKKVNEHRIVKASKLKINDQVFDGSRYRVIKSVYTVGVHRMVTYKDGGAPSEFFTSASVTVKG